MTDATREPDPGGGAPATEAPRGWVGLYAVAFGLVMASGAVLAAAGLGLFQSTRLLWASSVLSVLAGAAAVASVTVTRR